MKLTLTRDDLVAMARGVEPGYEEMDHPKVKPHGWFSASYGRWDWHWDAFDGLSEEEIFQIYLICSVN